MLWFAAAASGATYHITTTGNDSADGSVGTPWLTLQKAGNTAVSNDTVIVNGGIYAGGLSETTRGITYIANGHVTNNGYVEFTGSYCRMIGATRSGCSWTVDRALSGTGSQHGLRILGATNCEIWHVDVKRYLNVALYSDGTTTDAAGNVFIGCNTTGDFGDPGVDAGDVHTGIMGDDNLIAYMDQYTTANDFNNFAGDRNRFYNLLSRNAPSTGSGHPDQFQTGGAGFGAAMGGTFNLFESLVLISVGGAQDHHHWWNLEANGADFHTITIRGGIVHNTSSGSGIFQNFNRLYIYNNNWVTAQRWEGTPDSAINTPYAIFLHANTSNAFILNNIWYEAWGSGVTAPQGYLHDGGAGVFDNRNNLGWDAQGGSPTWAGDILGGTGEIFANPSFVDIAATNFWLQGGSAASGAGAALTFVNNANGAGTSFDVDLLSGGLFRGASTVLNMYGGNLAKGDKITVGTDQLQIASISDDTITVAVSFTWADNDPVYLGWDTTPDIGALSETSGVELTAATYTAVGSTYTCSPNGLTRWVVFFQDGIPHTVDESSPYTASISSGTVTIKAYAQKAQMISVFDAVESGGAEGSGTTYRNKGRSTRSAGIIP